MTKQEMEKRKKELLEKIERASEEELVELRKEVEELQKEEITEEPETGDEGNNDSISAEEERNLLRNTIESLEQRSIDMRNAKEIKNNKQVKEERKMEEEENKVLEQRGADLKAGKKIIVGAEERATTVSSGTVLVPKKYKDEIDESFESVSGIVDKLNTIPLNGGESYDVPFEISYGEGDYTDEAGDYSDVDIETGYVSTGRAKITAYTEITKEATKLPNAKYQALVIKRVRDAVKKKIGAQAIVGAGGANQITGIYHADIKVMPKEDGKTADIEIATIDADTLNKIVFAYGGSESVEGVKELILSKVDLEAFSKVKTEDGKFVYNIKTNGTTGTIGYKDGGLEVPYVINSACKALSKATTATGDYTMTYGSLASYECPIFSDLEIQESKDYKFKQGMICYAGDIIIGGTVAKYNGFVRVKKAAGAV